MKRLANILFIAALCAPSWVFAAATGDASIPAKAAPVVGDKITIGDSEDVNGTTGKLRSKDITLGALPVSTPQQTALDAKANTSCFADASAFNACFGLDWTTGGTFDQAGNYTLTGSWDFTGATVTGISGGSYTLPTASTETKGGIIVGDRLTITDGVLSADVQSVGSADSLTAQYIDWAASSGGSSIANKPPLGPAAALDYGTDAGDLVRLVDDDGSPALPFSISYNDIADTPTIPADVGDLTDTEGLLGGGGYTNLTSFVGQTPWRLFYSNADGDVVELGLGASGKVLKSNGDSAAPTWEDDSTAAGAGYVSTPPTYSDEDCTAGQYAFSTTTGYVCISSGDWNTFSLTDWNNPTPDTTPNAFSFVDQTDVALSTEITSALVQIAGINAATAVSASGGTAAICTSSDVGDCGTFGTNPGNITNNQYIAARHTSSASAEDAVNTVVTVGGVSDTFTSTTAASVAVDQCGTDGLISVWHMESTTVTDGTPSGCSVNDTTASLESGAVLATTQVYDGTYSLFGDGTFARAAFSNSDSLLTNGKISAVVYIGAGEYVDNLIVFEAVVDTSNRVRVEFDILGSSTDIRPRVTHIGGGTADYATIADTGGRTEGEWFYLEAGWKEESEIGNDMYIKVCNADGVSNCTTVEMDNDPAASTGTPSIFSWGSNSSLSVLKSNSGLDYGRVWNVSGY